MRSLCVAWKEEKAIQRKYAFCVCVTQKENVENFIVFLYTLALFLSNCLP